jgi:acetyl-CoA carboxylase carboxyl transferase subunit alpha
MDEIVPEPIGGAHNNAEAAAGLLDAAISNALQAVGQLEPDTRVARRYEKFRNMGRLGIDFVETP